MIRVGVAGATGYMGAELLRLLAVHPKVKLVAVAAPEREFLIGLPAVHAELLGGGVQPIHEPEAECRHRHAE